jgi:probable DNA metabolism protein
MRKVTFTPSFEGWQTAAREAIGQGWLPNDLVWDEGNAVQPTLEIFESEAPAGVGSALRARVPKGFIELARNVALHSSDGKWPLLYRILWRLTHGEAKLLENPADADFIALTHLEKEVSKDIYRMRAFVRFREVRVEDGAWFVAWYEPEHNTLECNAGFFTDRFTNMRWSILTPRRCMHWDGSALSFTEGVSKSKAPLGDEVEPLWITYYSRIFNPARVKVKAMQAQLPKRNWKNLPEAAVIAPLLRRVENMIARSEFQRVRDADFQRAPVPEIKTFDALRTAAAACRACPLWKNASCTVFGDGLQNAKIIMVGEQPGDQEDLAGKPFVGPAGQLLDRALAQAGVERRQLYVTNAVKHFKWEPRGKRRIHKTPSAREIAACRPWLEAELDLLRPKLIVSLGASAAQAIFGTPLRITQERGKFLDTPFGKTLITIHPSALLRLPDKSRGEEEFAKFVSDLARIAEFVGKN